MNISNDTLQTIAETFGFVIGGALIVLLSKAKEYLKTYNSKKIGRLLNKNAVVIEKMVEIRTILRSDRVKLFQFYNGQYFSSGESALKTSLTHINMKKGVALPEGISSVYKDMYVSRIIPILNPLLEKKSYFSTVANMPETEWKYASESSGTKSILFLSVSYQNKIFGLVMVTFQDLITEPKVEDVREAEEIVREIAFIMQN